MQINQTKIKSVFHFLSISILSGMLITGCTQNRSSPLLQDPVATSSTVTKHHYKLEREESIPVIRYGRYRLVEVVATTEQRALLSQIVDINIPLNTKNRTTVSQGIKYLLLNSGYSLCSSEAIETLSRLELPLAHYHLGPIRLKEALDVLVGNTWQMDVDDRERTVCFTPINTLIDAQSSKDVNHETR